MRRWTAYVEWIEISVAVQDPTTAGRTGRAARTASTATWRAGWPPNCTATRRPRDADPRRPHRDPPQPVPLHVRPDREGPRDRADARARQAGPRRAARAMNDLAQLRAELRALLASWGSGRVCT